MRKLALLFLGFGLTWFAAQPTFTLVRDGVGLALIGAILFAVNIQTPLVRSATLYSWPGLGQTLFGAGVATGVAGAALRLLDIPHAAIVIGVGVVILLAGVWQRGAPVRYAPPSARWERDAQGRFVRVVSGEPIPNLERGYPARWRALAVLLVLAAATAARLFWLDGLPSACTDRECLSALTLTNGQNPGGWLFSLVARVAYGLSDDALWSVRFAGACIGSLTLPLFWLVARRRVSPDGALLGLLLLSFLPWHLWASRHAAPWIDAPLWMCVVLWAGIAALQGRDRRHWAAAAVALGLLLTALPAVSLAWSLWWLALAALALTGRPGTRRRDLLLVLAAGAPFFLTVLSAPPPGPGVEQFLAFPRHVVSVFAPLWAGGDFSLTALLAPPVSAALVIIGTVGLVRYHAAGVFVLAGLAAGALGLAARPSSVVDPTNDALVLLAPLMLAAATAIDQLVGQTQRVWAAVVRPQMVAVVAGGVLLLTLAVSVMHLQQVGEMDIARDEKRVAWATAQYLTTLWGNDDSSQPLALLPQALFDDPLVQLAAAEAIQTGLARPFDLSQHLPLLADPAREAVYLFPAQEFALRGLAQAVYPTGQSAPILGEDGATLLYALRVPGAALADARGLAQTVFTADGATVNSKVHEPLHFAWGDSPSAPHEARWQGSLLMSAAGEYRFAVQSPPGALFSLLLDNRLVLDTSAGLTEQTITLPQGWQEVDMRLRADAAGDLVVQWQPPGGELTPIPADVLFNPALPNMGLQAAYFAADDWAGSPIAQRKDWLIRPDDSFTLPYSVHWQGKLAAPRGGETLLGVVTNGAAQVDVDGRRVIDFRADPALGEMTAEGVMTLAQGWHDIAMYYTTGSGAPEFKLYWQPPGSGPAPLPPEMLTPMTADLAALDLPLPAPPPLVDERLGDDSFALSASIDLWQPRLRLPPVNLPELPLTPVGKAGGCGSGLGQLSAPHGVVMDPVRDVVYVADVGNRRVVRLGLDGQEFEVLAVEGLVEPVDVALSPDGDLLILDAGQPGVTRFNPHDGSVSQIDLQDDLQRPRGLSVDGLGLLYVADAGSARVVVFGPDGRLMAEFGGPGVALGQGQPVDALATGRSIWAIAAEHGRLWQLDTLGSLTAVQPTDADIAPHLAGLPDGRFFVSDPGGRRIVFFGANGRPLAHFDAADALAQPVGVFALVNDGQFVLAITDAAACTVSLWRMAADELPQ